MKKAIEALAIHDSVRRGQLRQGFRGLSHTSGLIFELFASSTVWAVAKMKIPRCECALSRVANAASETDRNLKSAGGSAWILTCAWACLLKHRHSQEVFEILACDKASSIDVKC